MAAPTDPPAPRDSLSDLYSAARECMVNSQIRPNKVNDPRILSAMRRVRREAFLPAGLAHLAYLDEDVPLGNGRVMLEPMVLARLLQSALLIDNERVLVVGAGSGYGAAVLAACGARVTALEEDPALIALAQAVLPTEAPAVTLVTGPLSAGWPAGAPYDVILIEGAVAAIPPALIAQVHRQNGRILTALAQPNRTTQAVIGEITAGGMSTCPLFDCATPLIPSLRPVPAFQF
jgi:protein-L-isoaspartate(D-aspartate) O-methyltransferase